MIKYNLFPLTHNRNIFEEMDRLMSSSFKSDSNYPPYNVFRDSDKNTFIEVAVSGFSKEDLSIYINDDGDLVLEGTKKNREDIEYIHKSLSTKDFKRTFRLDKSVEVNEIKLENGILLVKLQSSESQIKQLTIN